MSKPYHESDMRFGVGFLRWLRIYHNAPLTPTEWRSGDIINLCKKYSELYPREYTTFRALNRLGLIPVDLYYDLIKTGSYTPPEEPTTHEKNRTNLA